MKPHRLSLLRVSTVVAFIVAFFSIAGCAGTQTTIESQWTKPGPRPQFTNVAVLYKSADDGTIRRNAEDRLVLKLRADGIRAEPAYAHLTSAESNDVEKAKAKLRMQGFDGLIVMRTIDVEQYVEYVPSTYGGYWGYSGYWGGYGSPYYGDGYSYLVTDIRVETTAYALPENKLVWSAITESDDVDSTKEVVGEVTTLVAGELEKRGVIATGEPPAQTATR